MLWIDLRIDFSQEIRQPICEFFFRHRSYSRFAAKSAREPSYHRSHAVHGNPVAPTAEFQDAQQRSLRVLVSAWACVHQPSSCKI